MPCLKNEKAKYREMEKPKNKEEGRLWRTAQSQDPGLTTRGSLPASGVHKIVIFDQVGWFKKLFISRKQDTKIYYLAKGLKDTIF